MRAARRGSPPGYHDAEGAVHARQAGRTKHGHQRGTEANQSEDNAKRRGGALTYRLEASKESRGLADAGVVLLTKLREWPAMTRALDILGLGMCFSAKELTVASLEATERWPASAATKAEARLREASTRDEDVDGEANLQERRDEAWSATSGFIAQTTAQLRDALSQRDTRRPRG